MTKMPYGANRLSRFVLLSVHPLPFLAQVGRAFMGNLALFASDEKSWLALYGLAVGKDAGRLTRRQPDTYY